MTMNLTNLITIVAVLAVAVLIFGVIFAYTSTHQIIAQIADSNYSINRLILHTESGKALSNELQVFMMGPGMMGKWWNDGQNGGMTGKMVE